MDRYIELFNRNKSSYNSKQIQFSYILYLKKMLLKLLKGSAIYGLSPLYLRLYLFATASTYKVLNIYRFRHYRNNNICSGLCSSFSTLGLQVILPNYFYKCPFQYKIIWREIYGFLSLWMVAFAILQSFLLYFTIPIEALENRFLIIFYLYFLLFYLVRLHCLAVCIIN